MRQPRLLQPAPPGPALLAAIGVALLLWASASVGLPAGGDRWLGDVFGALAPLPHRAAAPLLVAIDDATIRSVGRWPIPRRTYAELLAALGAAGARAVGIDLLFLDADAFDPAGDSLLAAVAADQPNMVFAVAFEAAESPAGHPPAPLDSVSRDLLRRRGVPAGGGRLWPALPASLPLPQILAAASRVAHVVVAVDPDGVVRRIPLFMRWDNRFYDALALSVAGLARGAGHVTAVEERPHALRARWSDGSTTEYPIDRDGTSSPRFRPDLGRPETISAADILASARRGDLSELRRRLAGRIVLVGNTAAQEGTADLGATWNDPATPLVVLHAAAVEALMAGRLLRPIPGPATALFALLLALGIAWPVTRWSPLRALAAGVGLQLLAFVAALLLYGLANRVVPFGSALLAVPLAAGLAGFWRWRHDEKAGDRLRGELERARDIQRSLLPGPLADRPDLDLAAYFDPTDAVGGDLYSWFALEDDRLVFALADVSGKGLPAALRAQELHGLLRGSLQGDRDLVELAGWLNAQLLGKAPRGSMVTLCLAALQPDGRTLTWVNCGHEPALLVRRGTALWLLPTGDALGLFPDALFRQEECPVQKGDMLIFCTDGVTEAGRAPHSYELERLKESALRSATPTASSATVLRAIRNDLERFTGGTRFDDDVCLVVLQLR